VRAPSSVEALAIRAAAPTALPAARSSAFARSALRLWLWKTCATVSAVTAAISANAAGSHHRMLTTRLGRIGLKYVDDPPPAARV